MERERLTLDNIKKSPAVQEHVFRVSDFLTEEEQEKLQEANARGGKIQKPFDEVDAFAAELMARFGWEAYQAWRTGEFDGEKAFRFVAAERARQKRELLPLEVIIVGAVAGANHPTKHKTTPSGLKQAIGIIKKETKLAKGAQ